MEALARANADPVAFNEADHSYSVAGTPTLSVTRVLSLAGMIGGEEWFTESARQRGDAAHAACHYDDEGELEEASVDPVVLPRLQAWRAIREPLLSAGWAFLLREQPLGSSALRLAGTPDVVLYHRARPHILRVIDLKTSAVPAPWWGLQLAGYAVLLSETYGIARYLIQRASVRLLANGTARLTEYTDRRDVDVFNAALTVALWRQENLPNV